MDQREIKFRAYWKKSKRMIDENFIDSLEKWEKLCNEDKELAERFTGLAIGFKIPALEILRRFYDCPIMQFTGLKDKNGKECFEGDLVKLEGMERIYEVVFENASFYGKQDKKESLELGSWYKDERLEIVGNIFEK